MEELGHISRLYRFDTEERREMAGEAKERTLEQELFDVSRLYNFHQSMQGGDGAEA